MTVTELFRLDGKVAIVTGASSGLGVAFAQALAEAGADVALGARRVDRLADTAELVEDAGRRALAVGTDVRRPASCTTLVEATMERVRPRRRAGQQRRRSGPPCRPPARAPERVPPGHRRQPERLLLDGPGLRPRHAAGLEHHQRLLGARPHHRRAAAGGLRLVEGGPDRADARPGRSSGPGRKGIRVNAIAPGFFESEMTEQYPPGYLESTDGADPRRPQGRPARAGGHGRLPGLRRPRATSPARRCAVDGGRTIG